MRLLINADVDELKSLIQGNTHSQDFNAGSVDDVFLPPYQNASQPGLVLNVILINPLSKHGGLLQGVTWANAFCTDILMS